MHRHHVTHWAPYAGYQGLNTALSTGQVPVFPSTPFAISQPISLRWSLSWGWCRVILLETWQGRPATLWTVSPSHLRPMPGAASSAWDVPSPSPRCHRQWVPATRGCTPLSPLRAGEDTGTARVFVFPAMKGAGGVLARGGHSPQRAAGRGSGITKFQPSAPATYWGCPHAPCARRGARPHITPEQPSPGNVLPASVSPPITRNQC